MGPLYGHVYGFRGKRRALACGCSPSLRQDENSFVLLSSSTTSDERNYESRLGTRDNDAVADDAAFERWYQEFLAWVSGVDPPALYFIPRSAPLYRLLLHFQILVQSGDSLESIVQVLKLVENRTPLCSADILK